MSDAPAPVQHHVLVAEDDDALRAMVTSFLQKKGYRVTAVSDGPSALAALAQRGVDLCLLDVMMPGLTGFQVLAASRARGDGVPIMMATAVANPDVIVQALEGGADDYITKPFALPVLAARVAVRLRLQPKARTTPLPMAHTRDLLPPPPEEDVGDDAIVEEAPAAAPDERSLLSRLRAAADVFKRRKDAFSELTPGSKLAERYQLVRKIGEGGFGVVFEARHLDLDQNVAVKLLRPGTTAASVESFRREAQNASRVRHDHAVRVMDFGIEKTVAFIVMELLQGRTTEEEVTHGGALEVSRASTIGKSVLSALTAAHAQGMIHRDVKPHNIVLHQERGREIPKLLDFGIAKGLDEQDVAGVLVGSAAFIAPERFKGLPYDGRADVYSMGVVLYRLFTGRLPFAYEIDDFERIAHFHLHEDVPLPSSVRAELSRTVDRTLLRLMEKDPHKRPHAEEAESLVEQLVWEAQLG